MNPGIISGWTNSLGAPKDWNEAVDGPCAALHVCITRDQGASTYHSAWYPDAEELAQLNAGAPVLAMIRGGQPPMRLVVGDPSDATP